MRTRNVLLVSVFIIAVIALTAVLVSDDSDATARDNVRVFIEKQGAVYDPDDYNSGYLMTTVSGVDSIKDAADKALEQLGMGPMVLNTKGNIESVDGRTPGTGEYWVVHQWLPLGTPGWGEVRFTKDYDQKLMTGSSICIHISTIDIVDGKAVYTKPEFKPVSEGYVFIRFVIEYNNPGEYVQEAFTEEVRVNGFWLKGEGSSLGEVLVNAMEANDFEIDVFIGTDSGGNAMSYWINTMFGLDTIAYPDSTYAYWSQFTYLDNYWGYNDWTMGYYDPAVYPYLGCFYLISSVSPMGIDIGEPPDMDNIVPIKRYNTVEFELDDGTVVDTQILPYGEIADVGSVPAVTPPEGYIFEGWLYDDSPIVLDTKIYGHFAEDKPNVFTVTYISEGTVLYTESVISGEPAQYPLIPQKLSTERYNYTFTGWDAPLDCVTEDISTNAVFIEELRTYKVTFYNFDNSVLAENYAYYDSPVECPKVPPRESSVEYTFTFIGWSASFGGFTDLDMDHIRGMTLAYAYFEKNDRLYSVTFMDGSSAVNVLSVRYGDMLENSLAMTLMPGFTLTFYHDPYLTEQVESGYKILGDKTIYLKKIAGVYTADGSSIFLELNVSAAESLPYESNTVTVTDVSQMSNIRTVTVSEDSVMNLLTVYSKDDSFSFITYKGTVYVPYPIMSSLIGFVTDGPSGESGGDISVTVSAGRINSTLNKMLAEYSNVKAYNVYLSCGTRSITDLSQYGADVTVALPADGNDGVLFIEGGTKVVPLTASAETGRIIIKVGMLGMFCSYSTSGPYIDEPIVDPVGEVSFETMGGGISITSIRIDNRGATYFIPENYHAKTVCGIGANALAGVQNAPCIVVPSTVTRFDWGQVDTGLTEIYFLGDMPVFTGSMPSDVSLYVSSDASGWGDEERFQILRYLGDGFEFYFYVVNGEAVICGYGYGNHITVPESIMVDGDMCTVKYIGDGAFEDSPLKIITIGKSVQRIMSNAFDGSYLYKAVIDSDSENLLYIGERAFADTALINTDIPDSVIYIGFEAFRYCSKITRFNMPESVLSVEDGAFSNCSDLQKVILSPNIDSIPARCFEFCYKLDNIEIPMNVVSIGDNAFYKCAGLSTINLRNVVDVGANAFGSCESLDYTVLGSSVMSLGNASFIGCRLLDGIDAYCEKPEGFEKAFGDISETSLFVRSSVAGSWAGYDYELLDTQSQAEQSSDPMPFVLLIIVLILVVVAAVSLHIRHKLFSGRL